MSNHDIADFDNPHWVRQFRFYINSGDPRDLPPGVTYFNRRTEFLLEMAD